MRRFWSLNGLAAISLVITVVTAGATPWIRSTEAAGPHIDLYFMSALARSANPLD